MFIPTSVNPDHADILLPRNSLNGKVDISMFNFSAKAFARLADGLDEQQLLTFAVQHLEQENLPRSDRFPGYPQDRNNSNTPGGARFFDPNEAGNFSSEVVLTPKSAHLRTFI